MRKLRGPIRTGEVSATEMMSFSSGELASLRNVCLGPSPTLHRTFRHVNR